MPKSIYTIGHSTRSIEDFIGLLKSYEIDLLIDVRTIPKSRHNPQFNKKTLERILKESHIHYQHLTKLGGLRHTTKNSINTGWHNLSFRGFADYMHTPSFWQGIEALEVLGKKYKSVIMCAEAVPWRCHRSLIADALTLYKWKVFHIISKKSANVHKLTPFLHVKNDQLIYSDKLINE
jgi:uncharacterized protein (DUF488 family)